MSDTVLTSKERLAAFVRELGKLPHVTIRERPEDDLQLELAWTADDGQGMKKRKR